jgi:2-enoate reductase
MHKYQELFEPIQIGKVQIKNRIAMAPMATLGLMNPDGTMTQRALDYYIERARGRVGLIISGVFKVENDIDPLLHGTPIVSPGSLASFVELVEALHALNTRIFVQLTAGFGRVSTPFMLRDRPVSASATPNYWDPDLTCRELDAQEVQQIVKAFGDAAALLGDAGVDGIELHGHEGYLFDQFTSTIWNKRNDKYGGDMRSRLAFPIEAMQAIKDTLGEDYPVQYRYGARHYMKDWWQAALPGEEYREAGRDVEESVEMARLLEGAGFDALHIDAGSYDSWYWAHPPLYMPYGCMLDLAAAVKEAVSIPVIAVGRLEAPDVAAQALRDGQADMVAIGRGLLTDEHWVRKVEEDRTRHIRPCIGCHDGCMGRIFSGRPLSCAVNPAVGRERLYALPRAETPRDVMVIGGGMAGLEVARGASLRGHHVTLYEKGEALGGHVIPGSVPAFKKETAALLEWFKTELDALGTEVHLNSPVTPKMVMDATPDVVVVATGSEPVIPNVPGIQNGHVVNEIEFLMGEKPVGECITVVGGGLVGCEAALWAAQNGKQVTIVEQLDELMSAGIYVPLMNKMMLLDLLKHHGVRIITGLTLTAVAEGGVMLMDRAFNSTRVECDSVVIAVGFRANRSMYDELLGATPNLYLVGDAREPRNIRGAIWDGYEVARGI